VEFHCRQYTFSVSPWRIIFDVAGGLTVGLDVYQARSCIWSVWPSDLAVGTDQMQAAPESLTVSRPQAEKDDHAAHARSSARRTCDWPYQQYMRRHPSSFSTCRTIIGARIKQRSRMRRGQAEAHHVEPRCASLPGGRVHVVPQFADPMMNSVSTGCEPKRRVQVPGTGNSSEAVSEFKF
jgi:hypothetical protein